MSLDALRQECLTCNQCSLAERRVQVVFGEGNPQADLVLVGEGPGDQEDKTGRPFIGRAGQMLDRALQDCGLSRSDDIYICNTVKCRAADWSTGRPQNRPPTLDEVATCRPWLIRQLQLIDPLVILCIGAPSAKNLIRKDFKITKERGNHNRSDLARSAIATLHPAYILRQQSKTSDGGYSLFVSDIQKAWDTAVKLRQKMNGMQT